MTISSAILRLFAKRSATTSAGRHELRYFLLVFDSLAGERLSEREFGDPEEAAEEFARLEEEHRDESERMQVLLFGALSRDALRETHPHYFRDSSERTGDTLEFLAGA